MAKKRKTVKLPDVVYAAVNNHFGNLPLVATSSDEQSLLPDRQAKD